MSKAPSKYSYLEEDPRSSQKIEIGQAFVDVLEAFDRLNSSLSQENIEIEDFKDCVQSFREAWKKSKMSLIPKVHLILDHLSEFVVLRGGRHMNLYAEQAHESLHYEFEQTWMKYQVKDVGNPLYKKRLLQGVCDFMGAHGE
jgi:hypothetical protein